MTNEQQKLDALAWRQPEERKAGQLNRLRSLFTQVKNNDSYYRNVFAEIDVEQLSTLEDINKLPFLSKEDLISLQKTSLPFGGMMNDRASDADFLFSSPGPIYEPGFMDDGYWRVSRALRAVGITSEDILHNTFSYHMTPGAWMMDSGAKAVGCAVIPAGTAPMEMQIEAIAHYQPTAFSGTPDFLKSILQAYQEKIGGPAPFKRALVSGGAVTPGLAEFFASSGVNVLQCYATAELGIIAYETEAREGLVVDENVIVEIINPETGDAVSFGEKGEVVVTTLRDGYPLFRFCTGDLSAFMEGQSPCGRTNIRIKGWMGRADQATKVRGMFVRPVQIKTLLHRNSQILKARLIVHRTNERDEAILHCELGSEVANGELDSIKEHISSSFRSICHVGCKVSLVPNGSIPDDGKVIVDLRESS